MNYYGQSIKTKLEKELQHSNAVVLVGARSTGKRTTAIEATSDSVVLDLEDWNDIDQLMRTGFSSNMVICSIEERPELLKDLVQKIEESPESIDNIVLTSIVAPPYLTNISLPAGKVSVIKTPSPKTLLTPPGSFYSAINEIADNYHSIPSTPYIQHDPVPAPEFWSELIDASLQHGATQVRQFLTQDIRRISPKIDVLKFRHFLQSVATHSATIINKAAVSIEANVSVATTHEYLKILEAAHIIRQIPYYTESKTKTPPLKMSKWIFRDTRHLLYLLDIHDYKSLITSKFFPQIIENLVIEEIIKGTGELSTKQWSYYFFKTRNAAHAELILKSDSTVIPIAIRSQPETELKDLRSLRHFMRENNLRIGFVINLAETPGKLGEGITQVSLGAI